MEISVIIPTYRPQGYLWECLDSLACQSFDKANFEVIIVLNGPKEPFYDEISRHIGSKSKSLNIRLIYTDLSGVSNARNVGLDNAEGRYIAFIDDDDLVSPSYLAELHEKADEDTIAACDLKIFRDGSGEMISGRMSEVFRELSPAGKQPYIKARRLFFTACQKLIPARIIGERRFDPDLSIGEDCLFMFLISDRIHNIDFTSSEAIYYRRVRKGSALMSFNNSAMRKMKNGLELIFRYTSIWLKGLRRYSFHFYLTRIRGALYSIWH